jgi:pimeloyl-ACP methyl ester carboxylesterase
VAVKASQLVRSMTLFGALLEPPQAMRDGLRARAAQARERGMFEIGEAVSDFALSPSTRLTQPVTVAYIRESMVAQPAEGYARNCLALGDAQAARTEHIHCPVLIVNGDEDLVTPLSGARQLADRLSNARVEVLSRCGHWPMLERTLESQRALSGFLERVR